MASQHVSSAGADLMQIGTRDIGWKMNHGLI
jgi:hypothetical protein